MVMGGSVAKGVGCEQATQNSDEPLRGRTCNWSVRLESFINTVLGYDAVHVVNIAHGGTSTRQALSIVKYWMYPPAEVDDDACDSEGKQEVFLLDIIIHAFGSNDNSHLGDVPAWSANAYQNCTSKV